MIYIKRLIFLFIIATACQALGNLSFVADINNSLKEVSAIEYDRTNNMFWVIEDSGNKNNLYGLNAEGKIIRDIDISNADNIDWEDLTKDDQGNIYIGDFGNNDESRQEFVIYKIDFKDLNKKVVNASVISFKLPQEQSSKDIEAFFLLHNNFYFFSKESKKFVVFRVPNMEGVQIADVLYTHNLNHKNSKITSADISEDGTIVLLNHDRLWKLSNYNDDDFFSGDVTMKKFLHNSQKEGICFKGTSEVYISDEREGGKGGNIYSFKIQE